MQSIIIFASGAGSNAAAIIEYFRHNPTARVSLIVCNKPEAGVLGIAAREGIPAYLLQKGEAGTELFIQKLQSERPALIVLAGFLWKIPAVLVAAFPQQIINLHPALLPDFGGKGMWGQFVHEAVLAAQKKESGITIHYVDDVYDSGAIILQARCLVEAGDTPSLLATRIHRLEHFYLPRAVEYLLSQQ